MLMLAHFFSPFFDNTRHIDNLPGLMLFWQRGLGGYLFHAFGEQNPVVPADFLAQAQERCQENHIHHTCSVMQ